MSFKPVSAPPRRSPQVETGQNFCLDRTPALPNVPPSWCLATKIVICSYGYMTNLLQNGFPWTVIMCMIGFVTADLMIERADC